MEVPVDNSEDLFKDYDVTENSREYEEAPEFPSIKINAVTSIPQEEFPAIEIGGTTSISEAAFMEDPSHGNEEDECMTEAVEITAMETEDVKEEAEEDLLKEQEPVNEVEEDHEEGCGVVKREFEEGDDGPNEDPNRDNTDSDPENDPEIAAALKVDNFVSNYLGYNVEFRPHC